ncbi:hypothetical protein HWV62_24944 [Athelia sp. TMB]|nr:hypothetical protein HWV62_24944 [Athelia sp. TMB]
MAPDIELSRLYMPDEMLLLVIDGATAASGIKLVETLGLAKQYGESRAGIYPIFGFWEHGDTPLALVHVEGLREAKGRVELKVRDGYEGGAMGLARDGTGLPAELKTPRRRRHLKAPMGISSEYELGSGALANELEALRVTAAPKARVLFKRVAEAHTSTSSPAASTNAAP